MSTPPGPELATSKTAPPGIPFQSPTVTVDHHDDDTRPALNATVSEPTPLQSFASPLRQHKRAPSVHREVKETLDARVEFANDEPDGRTQHRVNQYMIMEEIGRGSYGAVHKAVDQYGNEYAVKEFSKVRLRKRAQSQILRQGPMGMPRRFSGRAGPQSGGPLSPQMTGLRTSEKNDALFLIREEVAIMKKLNHPNLAQLIEVLDDPEEDSLYMVMEMCKKGVIMKVGLDEQAEPYSEEQCRFWFRDLMLGIEYLHAQGVIHRDIKPDNLLLSQDDVLKVVDFGVSEMFEKSNGKMTTAKSAGSPAFLPPELCGKHSEVSGKAADIWSMGISLFCLKYGKLPFQREGMLEIYEAIKSEDPQIPANENPDFADLIGKVLNKDPETRITMTELRAHPWVTKCGTDPLLSAEENCAHPIDPPNELELNRAFTRKMNDTLFVMRAIHRFKSLLTRRRVDIGPQLGSPMSIKSEDKPDGSFDLAEEKAKVGVIEALLARRKTLTTPGGVSESEKGQTQEANDPEPRFLGIGTGARDDFAMDEATPDVVSDSPIAVDFNVYDRAYEEAIQEHMKSNQAHQPILYLTNFVKEKQQFRNLENMANETSPSPPTIHSQTMDSNEHVLGHSEPASDSKLAHLVSKVGVSGEPAETKPNE